jgi:hypothetical protein
LGALWERCGRFTVQLVKVGVVLILGFLFRLVWSHDYGLCGRRGSRLLFTGRRDGILVLVGRHGE